MKKLVLFFLFFLFFSKLYSQSLIENMNAYSPPSPEAASLTSLAGQYSVSQYTGKLNYLAPITKVDFSGFAMDLNIQYSTSGFKVQDISGSLGLGWNANFGGVITRYVEGLPDEEENGYCGANRRGEKSYGTLNKEYLDKLGNAEWDSQPDKFYFSFLGYSGTLVLDPDGVPILSSSTSGLKVEYNPFSRSNGRAKGGLERWILRDQKGNQYFFGEEFLERTSSITHGEVKNVTKNYISSWFIKKIVTANNRTIVFNYTTGSPTNFTYYVNVYRNFSTSGGCTYSGPAERTWSENVDVTITEPLFLSQIKMEGGGTAVNFLYNFNRADLANGKALTDIEVLYNNKVKRAFFLHYDYFTSTDGTNTKRLKNNGISEKSSIGTVKKLFSFFYDESSILPARNSIKTDYWGYYNNNLGGSDIEGYLDASREPYFNNAKACVLSSVNYSTGGSIHFEYEQNNYKEGNSNVYAGGIRVKRKFEKVSGNNGEQNLINEEYIYTDPQTQLSSGQLYIKQQDRKLISDNIIPYFFGGTYWVCVLSNVYKYSVPLVSLFDLNETSVGYSVVSVKKFNGTTRYRFTNFSDMPDLFEQKIYNTTTNQEQTDNLPEGNFKPQYISTSNSFGRGKLKSEELLDIYGQKVKHTNYEYDQTAQSAPVIGLKAYPFRFFGTSQLFFIGRNKFFNQDSRLIRKVDTVYNAGKSTMVTKEEYHYTTYANNLISTKNVTDYGGKVVSERLKYPFDELSNSTFVEMCTNNRISEVIEQSKYSNNILVSKEFTNFNKWESGLIAASSVERQTGNGPKRSIMLFNNYDSYGNLLESQTPYGNKESYFWGYDNNFLVAKVVGSSYNNAKQFIDLTILDSAGNYTDFQLNDELNKLRVNLTGSQVTTNSYNPLIGATSQTDPKNKTSYFEYDEFGRLNTVKNQNQDIVKTYDYHIANQYQSKATVHTFARNNCSEGLIAGFIDYILPEGSFTSYISQSDADEKAENDAILNGQSYANQYGKCKVLINLRNEGEIEIPGVLIISNNTILTGSTLEGIKDGKTITIDSGRYYVKFNPKPGHLLQKILICVDGEYQVIDENSSLPLIVGVTPINILVSGLYYTNSAMSESFSKSDCPSGQVGVNVDYAVPADRYYSGISNDDANLKAKAEIQLNGQDYANRIGSCIQPGVNILNSNSYQSKKVMVGFFKQGVNIKTIEMPQFLSNVIDTSLPPGNYQIRLNAVALPGTYNMKFVLNNSITKTGTTIQFDNVEIGSSMIYLEMLELWEPR